MEDNRRKNIKTFIKHERKNDPTNIQKTKSPHLPECLQNFKILLLPFLHLCNFKKPIIVQKDSFNCNEKVALILIYFKLYL